MWVEGSAINHKWNNRRIKWDLEQHMGWKLLISVTANEIYEFLGMTLKFFANREGFKIRNSIYSE